MSNADPLRQMNNVQLNDFIGDYEEYALPCTPGRRSHFALIPDSGNPRDSDLRKAPADHRQDAFLAVLSHELRTPLAAIRHGIRLLTTPGAGAAAQQKARELVDRQVCQMARLVDDLLDVSRIATGRLSLQCERVDLRIIANHAIETLQPDIDAHHHRLSSTAPAEPVWVQGDCVRLEQVFVNLLANASRYTPAGGDLALCIFEQGGHAVATLRDSGIGMDATQLSYIFDLFRQADSTAAQSRPGLGIGLAVVRNIVEHHGGCVTAASTGLGFGSEFTVHLPLESRTARSTQTGADRGVGPCRRPPSP